MGEEGDKRLLCFSRRQVEHLIELNHSGKKERMYRCLLMLAD